MSKRNRAEINPLNKVEFTASYYGLLEERKRLDIWKKKQDFIDALLRDQIIIVSGKPGIGKSTQTPQFVLEAFRFKFNNLMVGCTQPNRVATMTAAYRVSQELDVEFGHQVGCSLLFENYSSKETVLKQTTSF